MRVIGNKTHGDLAEIALTEYINEFVDGYMARHTGKETFRAKKSEEDITVKDEKTGEELLISIKTYGFGPLQLSTNKDSSMFNFLRNTVGAREINEKQEIDQIIHNACFANFNKLNVIPLIYNEADKTFKIIIFDTQKAYSLVKKIKYFAPRKFGKKKTHPIYKFFGEEDQYIFEVRYGDTRANALQRGMWTHTENAVSFFNKILEGSYEINKPLLDLISKILIVPRNKHEEILRIFFKNNK